MDTIILCCILFILLVKPITVLVLYAISIIFYYFISGKIAPESRPVHIVVSDNSFKKSIKQLLGRYVGGIVYYSISETGRIPFHTVRNFIYRYFFRAKLGKNVVIYSGALIRGPNKLTIGKGTMIGNHSVLDARNSIEIGENVTFGHGVWLWSAQHSHNDPDFGSDPRAKLKKITVHDRAWLGPRVIVLPGCTIGEGAVIGAGAVVTKDIEPFSINAGVPARKIGERNRDINYVFNGKALPFV